MNTTTQLDAARKIATAFIGNKRLCGLRNGKKVKFFVADELRGEMVVTDVSCQVARVLDRKIDDNGWINPGNPGYCPIQYLAECYYQAMELEDKPFLRL